MNSIRSTIGESNFSGVGPRRFVVGNETPEYVEPASAPAPTPVSITPEMAANLRRQAQEQQSSKEQRQLGEARRRVEIITGIGRRIREVPLEFDGASVVVTLRTLKTFEYNFLSQVIENTERITLANGTMVFSPTGLSRIKVEALSHSLFLIDGQSVDIILGTANSDYETQIVERKKLIEEMDHALINHLYDNYEILTKETYDGYNPKTAEEAKEVVETISKSG
jgi:hypothetical protein